MTDAPGMADTVTVPESATVKRTVPKGCAHQYWSIFHTACTETTWLKLPDKIPTALVLLGTLQPMRTVRKPVPHGEAKQVHCLIDTGCAVPIVFRTGLFPSSSLEKASKPIRLKTASGDPLSGGDNGAHLQVTLPVRDFKNGHFNARCLTVWGIEADLGNHDCILGHPFLAMFQLMVDPAVNCLRVMRLDSKTVEATFAIISSLISSSIVDSKTVWPPVTCNRSAQDQQSSVTTVDLNIPSVPLATTDCSDGANSPAEISRFECVPSSDSPSAALRFACADASALSSPTWLGDTVDATACPDDRDGCAVRACPSPLGELCRAYWDLSHAGDGLTPCSPTVSMTHTVCEPHGCSTETVRLQRTPPETVVETPPNDCTACEPDSRFDDPLLCDDV